MPRRRRPQKRIILPDPKYKDQVVAKFINGLMYNGKKSIAEKIFYDALDIVEAKTKKVPIDV
jgi:small subunit ribosomal protein S7